MSEAKFNLAVQIIADLPKDGPVKPTPDDQLFFYKYFKQAKFGDNETAKPSMLSFDLAGKAKWEAWTSVKGATKEECYKQYVEKLLELLRKAPDDEQSKKYIAELESEPEAS